MSRRWTGFLVCVVFCAVVLVAGASAATTVTIGQTSALATYVCTDEIDAQAAVASGTGFVVPSGNWLVTSWSTYAGSTGGKMSMVLYRSEGGGTYLVVGESPVETLTAGQLNTFTLATPIAVQPGDVLGLWADGARCATHTHNSGDFSPYKLGVAAPPTSGSTVDLHTHHGSTGWLLNISATLSAALPTTKDDCKDGGWQSFGVFRNQGDCVSYVATGGKNPANGG